MRQVISILILSLLIAAPSSADCAGAVIVRHAEKAEDGTKDPGLTEAGHARAEALADALEGVRVAGLIASQYRRTRLTLSALERREGVDPVIVPAGPDTLDAHVEAIAARVRDSRDHGVWVIAGHSNTVPRIVEALSGDTIAPIDESTYDRIFVLIPAGDGFEVVTARYGAASPAPSRPAD
ncbi:MAG: histidine phosphatase family protein [Gammaproteobacteria bacterium]|jgi:phosphohistidine phosphatase SixA|nr:histidine phosphatase family protein [Gammaproteobacteria bacterium]